MDTPGVGVLIDPDKIDQIDCYFIDINGTRYYGSSPEDSVRKARAAIKAKKRGGTSASRSKKSVTNIISLARPTTLVADQMMTDQKLLSVSAKATAAEIKAASKKAVLAAHSNRGGTGDVGAITAARDRLLAALPKTPTTAKGGGKRRKPLKKTRVFRKYRSMTRKHIK
jgi:hypothetical protein